MLDCEILMKGMALEHLSMKAASKIHISYIAV